MKKTIDILFFSRTCRDEVWEYDFILNELITKNVPIKSYFLSFDEVKNSDREFDIFVYSCRDTDIIPGGDFGADCHDFLALDVGSFVDDDVEEFTTATINSNDNQSQSDRFGGRPTHDRPSVPPLAPCAFTLSFSCLNLPREFDTLHPFAIKI